MTKVLLTGGGGAHTHSVLRSLTELGYEVLSADASFFAAGTAFAKRGYVVPFAMDPEFASAIERILHDEQPSFVVPLVDEEIPIVHRLVARSFKGRVRVVAPRLEFCEAMLDKWVMYQRLSAAGLAVARTWLANDADGCPYPAIVKPRTGRGSRGLAYLRGSGDLARYLRNAAEPHDRYIVQERVDGKEFTTSAVVGLDGETIAVVPKEVLAKRGITQLGATRRNAAIDRLCREIQDKLRADGPFNVQLMLRDDGAPSVFEINPRYSTTSVLTLAAGVNEFDAVMRRALGKVVEPATWQPDLVMIRHAKELYVQEGEWKTTDLRPSASPSVARAPAARRVLVTGATGFVGAALVPKLVEAGYAVTAIGSTRLAPPPTESLKVDLTDHRAALAVLAPWRWDAVVNLAAAIPKGDEGWENGAATVARHVDMALNLVAAVPDSWEGRIVHVSSMTVYGVPVSLPVTEGHVRRPLHHYGLAKRLAEDVILASHGVDRWVLRMGGLFAEHRPSGALHHFARAAVRGESLRVDASRSLPWEILHVDDAVDAVMRSLEASEQDVGAVNISYGDQIELTEIARWIATRGGRGSDVVVNGKNAHPPFLAAIEKARGVLGWRPGSLFDRLGNFVEHHAEEVK